jgi:hypothetical protein
MSTKEGYVPKTFTDSGTGETFEGGATHRFEPGAHANYAAAGLFGDAPAKTAVAKRAPAPRKPKATKPAPKRAVKPSAADAAPTAAVAPAAAPAGGESTTS